MLRSDQIRHLDDALYRRYLDKLRVPTTNNSFINIADPYSMNDGWTLDITEWPNVTFGDIYVYLIDSVNNGLQAPSVFLPSCNQGWSHISQGLSAYTVC
jgi:hypothetical protein